MISITISARRAGFVVGLPGGVLAKRQIFYAKPQRACIPETYAKSQVRRTYKYRSSAPSPSSASASLS